MIPLKKTLVALLLGAPCWAGCMGDPRVVRVYDGKLVEGRYVTPDGYAAYLRAVIAEENGDLKGALSQLQMAVAEDDDDAEVWARVGEVRCKAPPSDKTAQAEADNAFARALKADANYAGALAAKGRCLLLRGQHEEAAELAKRGLVADPGNVTLDALLVRADARRPNAQLRERAIALTVAHGERAAAWDALVAWSRARHDAELLARGLEGLLRAAPMRSAEVERGALDLLGEGHLALARRVASSITDAPPQLLVRGPQDATVARLAVDEALARGDRELAVRRATKTHVELGEVAARAALLERRDVAKEIAHAVLAAEPNAAAARMVLASVDEKMPKALDAKESVPEIVVLLLAERIASAGGVDVAKAFVERMAKRPLAPHDPLAGPLAVDLAARGVLAEASLGPELRIELAARRREPPPKAPKEADVDPRHELLFHALTDPSGAAAKLLAANLASAIDRDPVVAFAIARIALASGPSGQGALERLRQALASSPGSALLLSVLVEIAKRNGRTDDLQPARTRLMAVARTPAERALATE